MLTFKFSVYLHSQSVSSDLLLANPEHIELNVRPTHWLYLEWVDLSNVLQECPEMNNLVGSNQHVSELLRKIIVIGCWAFEENGDGIGRLLPEILLEPFGTHSLYIQVADIIVILWAFHYSKVILLLFIDIIIIQINRDNLNNLNFVKFFIYSIQI